MNKSQILDVLVNGEKLNITMEGESESMTVQVCLCVLYNGKFLITLDEHQKFKRLFKENLDIISNESLKR